MTDINVDMNFVGVMRTYHDKKQTKLKEEYFINSGKKEGIYKSYYKNGQLEEEVNYINDKKNGNFKQYYNNGKLWKEVNYINGKKVYF